MRIEGKQKYVRRAVFAACLFDVYDFDLKIVEGDETYVEKLDDKSFLMCIERGWSKKGLMSPIAHEMTHVAQYLRGDLDEVEGIVFWKGEPYNEGEHHSDEYYLAPYEMEARGMEAWVIHRWENRVELH